jgi:radical SAM superfamily enzyme YgiQ (UPF0313 family)
MKKIILIQVAVGYMDAQRNKPAPPLGLLAAASLLRQKYEILILDQRLYKNQQTFFTQLRTACSSDVLFVGFSLFTGPMIKATLSIAAYIKENCSVPIVVGGAHPSLLPEQTLKNNLIDFIIEGEGELTMLELADMLTSKKDHFKNIQGLWSKKDGQILYGGQRPFLAMNKLPRIPYELVAAEEYIQTFAGKKFIYYQASRGCPRSCKYCYNHAFNHGTFRARSIEKIIEDIRSLKEKYVFDGIFFVDDNIFCIGKKKLLRLAEGLKKLGLLWYVQGSDIIALVQYSLADFKKLERSGLTRLSIGVESASTKIRKLINKPGTLDQIRSVIKLLSHTSILIWCSYIINFPKETIDDLRKSIDFLLEMHTINKNVLNSPFFLYLPFPGTALYKEYGHLFRKPTYLEEWGTHTLEQVSQDRLIPEYLSIPLYQGLFLTSMLVDKKVFYLSGSIFLKIISFMYKPIATFRLKHLFFSCNLELFLFKKLFPKVL